MKNIFEWIDEYFEKRKRSEVLLSGLIIGAIFAFISYLYLFPISKKYYKTNLSENQSITAKLKDEESFVKSTNAKNIIKNSKNNIKSLKSKLNTSIKTNTYINEKLKELSYLLFDEKNWAKFLDDISTLAEKNGLKVLKIKNSINEPNPKKIEQILSIDMEILGSYHSIMKFINSLEQSMIIVDIYNIELKAKRDIYGRLNIAVWGMKY